MHSPKDRLENVASLASSQQLAALLHPWLTTAGRQEKPEGPAAAHTAEATKHVCAVAGRC